MSFAFRCDRCGKDIAENKYVLTTQHQPIPAHSRVGKVVGEKDLCEECHDALVQFLSQESEDLVYRNVLADAEYVGNESRLEAFTDVNAEFCRWRCDGFGWSEDLTLKFKSDKKTYAVEVIAKAVRRPTQSM